MGFILSHALVRDETYAAALRDWLGTFSGGALLILDEAHNVAPASGSKYAIDSKLTRAIRDLAPRFEHRLFLSATPHNGHSNSFSALLELLDPQRFCRGVPVDTKLRDEVMVRRLKSDLRAIGETFPQRNIVRVVIDRLSDDAPELVLSRLLQRYRAAREARLAEASRAEQAAAMLVVTSLQKRLLSSSEAFARTLEVHRRGMQRRAEQAEAARAVSARAFDLLARPPGADDDRAELDEDDVALEEDAQMEAATRASAGHAAPASELALLDDMRRIAQPSRYDPDARLRHLVQWVRAHQCPALGTEGAPWTHRRLLVFTEYADTKRYLQQQLAEAIRSSDRASDRIATFHGGIGEERREAIKAAFNADPDQHPLRILIATDAAREGVNLQNHCYDLFHFDVPWNPGRLEQRNGRIDRKLQRAPEVNCYYFVLPQRAEDRVLDVLVQKTSKIHEELGSLSPVVERRLGVVFREGIGHAHADRLARALDRADEDDEASAGRVRTLRLELDQGDHGGTSERGCARDALRAGALGRAGNARLRARGAGDRRRALSTRRLPPRPPHVCPRFGAGGHRRRHRLDAGRRQSPRAEVALGAAGLDGLAEPPQRQRVGGGAQVHLVLLGCSGSA